jgi:Rieske Fe-S protein
MSETPDPTRRTFLAGATVALGACAGAGALAPALAAILSPLGGGIVKLGEGLVDVGPLAALDDGIVHKVAVRAARTDAYLKEEARTLGSVLLQKKGDAVIAFASQCPHAGCDVAPDPRGRLVCPCHESLFGDDGSVQGGPSPRALDRLETQVKDGRVLVRFERFQVGVPDRRAL